jgi:hypothetical protein
MITYKISIEIFNSVSKITDESFISNFLNTAIDYARVRTDWYFMSIEEKREINTPRRIKHDAFISSFKAILNYLKENNIEVNWLEELPDYRSPSRRKAWGDLACFVHSHLGINSR